MEIRGAARTEVFVARGGYIGARVVVQLSPRPQKPVIRQFAYYVSKAE